MALREMVVPTLPAGPVLAVVQAVVVGVVAVEPPAAAIMVLLVRSNPGPGAVPTVGAGALAVAEVVATVTEEVPRVARHRPPAVAADDVAAASATKSPMK